MGKGGCYQAGPPSAKKWESRVPTAKPEFTIGTLRKAIPVHCFERSIPRSFAYLAADLAAIAVMYYLSTFIDHPAVPRVLAWGLLWPAYWYFQGAVATGVWVIAHECGHQAFSPYQWLNDAVGLVLHSCLLVPYYSWKHSHRRHHSNTGSTTKDEVFVPREAAMVESDFSLMQTAPARFLVIFVSLTAGWPAYLFANASGRKYGKWANHFDPYSPIFTKRERSEIVVSDVALTVVIAGLYSLGKAFGWAWLVKEYVIPYLIVNMWLVMITLLQHTHPELPHYADKEWDWLRGALATCDRSYGMLDHLHHHIADTHVAHHLFSTMPHYHAQEATEAIKPILGKYYKQDKRNVWAALWEDFSLCRYVAPDTAGSGILWFRA
uniref:Fatty acid delta-12-desaturase n=1 Tax=Lobosphaera incisa TaxID=312850 RepID=G9FT52_9CHLO|nr:fatty acid delta-12-desaturase [Lobosphaera incisa]